MPHVRYAVFIEPSEKLNQTILGWKARMARQFPQAPYLHHPPHSTVWVGEVSDAEAAFDALRTATAGLDQVPGVRCRPHVFNDDAVTGGQTCAFAMALTSALERLQSQVGAVLMPYRSPVTLAALAPQLRREPYLTSWHRFGFPFVGSHWIPHVTVASLPVEREDAVIREFLEAEEEILAPVRSLSWWRVSGDRHDRLSGVTLGCVNE